MDTTVTAVPPQVEAEAVPVKAQRPTEFWSRPVTLAFSIAALLNGAVFWMTLSFYRDEKLTANDAAGLTIGLLMFALMSAFVLARIVQAEEQEYYLNQRKNLERDYARLRAEVEEAVLLQQHVARLKADYLAIVAVTHSTPTQLRLDQYLSLRALLDQIELVVTKTYDFGRFSIKGLQIAGLQHEGIVWGPLWLKTMRQVVETEIKKWGAHEGH